MKRKKIKMIETNFFELSSEEFFSFELAKLWIELSEKYFPNYNHTHKKGWNLNSNPKKSIIFKTCYKLQRETKGLIEKSDYSLYIRAQLEILKIQSKNNPLVLIEPGCLVGEKAWKRWKLWKKRYDNKIKQPLNINLEKHSFLKAKEGLIRTKKFIDSVFEKNPTLVDYKNNKGNLINWLNFGNISPYYASISPFMKEVISNNDYKKLNFDIKLYYDCINEDIEKLFFELFKYEFDQNIK